MDRPYMSRPGRGSVMRQAMKSNTPSCRQRDEDSNSRSETTDEQKNRYENTYKMEPDNLPSVNFVQNTMQQAIKELIAGENDDFLEAEGRGHVCTKLSDDIRQRIKSAYSHTRYKFIVHVTIVQNFSTFQIGSRCLWNDTTDTHMTVSIPFGDSHIVTTCFAVYFE